MRLLPSSSRAIPGRRWSIRAFARTLLRLVPVLPLLAGSALFAGEPLELQSIHRLSVGDGQERHTTLVTPDSPASSFAVFSAVTSRQWPTGLVPIYAFERRGIHQLSRLPPKGQENFMDPLFFALPAAEETNTTNVVGHWFITAAHRDGHSNEFRWDLAADGEQIAGRFDPNTDYRFASIAGGTWKTNQLELKVDYINEHFELSGLLAHDVITGTWRRTDDGDAGTWTAKQDALRPELAADAAATVAIYEWTHAETRRRTYRLATEALPSPWQRATRPLCRVWPR